MSDNAAGLRPGETLCGTCRWWDHERAERNGGPEMCNRISVCLWGRDLVFPEWCGGLSGDRFTNELGTTERGCAAWERMGMMSERQEIVGYRIERRGNLCAVLTRATPVYEIGGAGDPWVKSHEFALDRNSLMTRIENLKRQGLDASVSSAALAALDAALSGS